MAKPLMRRPFGLVAAVLAVALLAAGCGGGGSQSPAASSSSSAASAPAARSSASSAATTTAAAEPVVVVMKNFRFEPSEIRVRTGQTVVFKNEDLIQHNVVQTTVDKGMTGPFGFDSGRIDAGKSWEYTFETPGEYPILCNVDAHHLAGMVANVIVE